MKFILFILPVFVLFCYAPVNAQQQPYFENITEKDGLTDNRVTCFLKDKIGYLWIGTESGLNKYNGNTFISYLPASVKKNKLSNAFITAIKQDATGDIWVTTRKGVNRIDEEADTTEIIRSLTVHDNIDLPGEVIWDVLPDTDTTVWLAIDAKSLVCFNPKTKQSSYFDFRAFLSKKNIEYTPSYHSIFKIVNKSGDELWMATTDGIVRFNKHTGEFTLEAGAALDEITFFYYDTVNRKLYCADERTVLYVYDEKVKKAVLVSLNASLYPDKYLAPYTFGNNLLFIPAPEGIALVNAQNKVVSFLKKNDTNEQSLLGSKITAVYKDHDSITWIGTTKGVNKFVPHLNNNLHVSFPGNLTFDPEYSLKNIIYHQATNEWWVASFIDNTVWKVNNSSGKITALKKPETYKNDICYAFYRRHPDTLFMLCDSIILIYYTKEKKWKRIAVPEPWTKGTITCMAIDKSGNYWFGSRRRGLFVYDNRKKVFWSPNAKNFSVKIIHAIAYDDNEDCLWIATYGRGLYKYSGQLKKFTSIERDDASPTAIHSSLINDVCIDEQENVWAATIEGGLAKYNSNTSPLNGVTSYDMNNILPSNNVYSIEKDAGGNILFTTNKGIGKMNTAGSLEGFYNTENGLPYSKFAQSIVALPDGCVATTVDNNLFCFYPSSLLKGDSYPVIINQVLVNDTTLVAKNNKVLTYQQNTIRFSFSALDFVSPGAIEYYYRLDGFEKDWIANRNVYTVRYSGLPPGKYTFLVKAKKISGVFYKQMAKWSFEIKPAFWQTYWFQLLVISCLTIVIYALFRRRVEAVRSKAAIKQQISELEAKALRAQMNPHFIFNAMNTIQQFTLKNDIDNASTYISKFSLLLRKVLHSSQHPAITLEEEIKQLFLYADIEKARMGEEFIFEVSVEEQIETDAVRIPGMLIQPFVENALKHGLALKEGQKKIMIAFQLRDEDCLQVIVTDNGIGRKQAAMIKKEQQKMLPYESKGIQMVKERLTFLAKTKKSVSFEDLHSDNGLPAGTRVIIQIPLNTGQ